MSEQLHQPNLIGRLNDTFRRSTREILLTPGVQALPDIGGLVGAVRAFNDFTPENDPYGHHNRGSITWHDQATGWQIDCYDQALQHEGDPLEPECRRILTVFLHSEY